MTRGAGEVIPDALKRACWNFIIGIEGSATNDGGIANCEGTWLFVFG